MNYRIVMQFGKSFWGLVIILFVLVGLFFLTQLGSWNAFIYRPGSEFSDLTVTFWPNIHYIQQSLSEYGQFPLWRTLIFSGTPFDSDPQSGLWYPPNLLFLVLPATQGFNTLFLLHMVAGGLGMWLWSRSTGTTRGGSFLTAIAVAFTPKVYAHLGFGHIGLLYGAAYIPWVLWGAYLTSRGKLRYGGVMALALGLQIIANPQIAVYTGFIGGVYGIFTAIGSQKNNRKETFIAFGYLVGAGLIALAIASVQVFPMLRFAPLSARSGMGLVDTAVSSLPPQYLLGLLLADHVGFMDYMIYVGLTVLGLAVLAYPRRQAWFWWSFVLLAFIYSMGDITPIYSIAFKLLPVISWLRAPTRVLFISSVVLALMAGWGFDHLVGGFSTRSIKLFNLVFVGMGAFALILLLGFILFLGEPPANMIAFGILMPVTMSLFVLVANKKVSEWFAVTALCVVLIVDLWVLNSTLIEGRSPAFELTPSELERYLVEQNKDEPLRIYSPSYSMTRAKGAYLGFESADGVDPLYAKDYDLYMQMASGVKRHRYEVTIPPFEGGNSVYDANASALPRIDMLGALNVKYILAEFPIELDGLQEIDRFESTYLYENQMYKPRFFVLGDIEVVDDFDQAMLWLSEHNPTNRAIVEGGEAMNSGEVDAEIRWIRRTPNYVAVQVTLDKSGLLVYSQASYLDWKVWVNGNEERLLRTNGIISGLTLTAGTHVVEFAYQPSTLYWGLSVSIVAVILALSIIYLNRSV